MKLKITKTKLDKELKNFVTELKKSKDITAYRNTLYSLDGTQRISFIFENKSGKSGKFGFKF